MSGFHGAFATGVASQQGTLTLPDTWFRPPFWDLLMLQLLKQNSSNLPCLYSTFHLEYPLVLSRFYFTFSSQTCFCKLVQRAHIHYLCEASMIAHAALVLYTPISRIQLILDSVEFFENYEVILAKFSSSCCYMLSFSFFFVVFIFCKVG